MGFINFNNTFIRADIIIAIIPKIITIVNASTGTQTEYAIRLITTDENVNEEKLEERYLSKEERDERINNLAHFMNRVEKIRLERRK